MSLDTPLTYLISPGDATDADFESAKNSFLETIELAVRARVSMVQIREKKLSYPNLFELASAAVSVTSGTETRLLINGSPGAAMAVRADGVHLPDDESLVETVPQLVPAGFIVGASVHSVSAAIKAKDSGVGFVMFGPVFAAPGKEPRGLDELETVCEAVGDFPVIAVGGIDETNFHDVLAKGAAGYAAIRYLNEYVRRV